MKLAWKIFCVTYIIVIISAGVGGFALLQITVSSLRDSTISRALTSNRYSGEILMTYFNRGTDIKSRKSEIKQNISKTCNTDSSDEFFIYSETDIAKQFDASSFIYELDNLEQGYVLKESASDPRIVAACRADFLGEKYYAVTSCSLSSLFAKKNQLTTIYSLMVFGVATFAGIALFIFSRHFAKPVKQLSGLADDISKGRYQKCIEQTKQISSVEEIKLLADSFNRMAQTIEQNINDLREEIEKRDIFVADFTHEIKTPMTSIIGYSDMLRSYSLPPDETRETADTIYSESKRLQQLSMKLLDIIVLKNQNLALSEIPTDKLFEEFKKSVVFTSEKYGVNIVTEYQSGVIYGDISLLLSLMYNLTENACKASKKGQIVSVRGEMQNDGRYLLIVQDHGSGIKKENLKKITEPFFTENKSRSRSLGGAGLGLALCKQIAALHESAIVFDSAPGSGTAASILLKARQDSRQTKDENENEKI